MWQCYKCNTTNDNKKHFCKGCGLSKSKSSKANVSKNHCSNPNCRAYNIILSEPEQKHCDVCGCATTYWKQIEDLI